MIGGISKANNITVSNVSLSGRDVSAGTNNAANFNLINCSVSWENSWRWNSSSGSISYICVLNGGSGYTSAPTISITGGGGSSATATATISGGVVTGITITNAGSGYTSVPTVSFSGGGGSGAAAEAYNQSWWDAAWVFVKFRVGASNPVLSNANSSGTTVTVLSTANLRVGMPVVKNSGTGTLAANTVISSITSSTQFELNNAPTVALSGATIECLRIWEHATLNTTAGNHTAPSGSTISVPADGKGVFLYRSAAGSGTFTANNAALRWQYGNDGVPDNAVVDVQVFATEMVYVPEGSFSVGSGGTESGSFTDGSWSSGATIPFQITSEAAMGIDNAAGKLWGTSSSGDNTIGNAAADAEATLAADFPKGYAAFYCMKYETTQGQYRDFLNTLTRAQQANRVSMDGTVGRYAGGLVWSGTAWGASEVLNLTNPSMRNGLRLVTDPGGNSPRTYACDLTPSGALPAGVNNSNDGGWLAMSQLNWMDVCAYMDWAGLRPMTELEFEKAARGNQAPLAGEYVWGTTSATAANNITNGGANNETTNTTNANASYGNQLNLRGAFRAGAFAQSATSRIQAGVSYYGILDMSGGMWERIVTVGNSTGRGYTGLHGDGLLSARGFATTTNWPGLSSGELVGATGSGFRGGTWALGASFMPISDRSYGAGVITTRYGDHGARGVRTAP